MCVCVCVCVCVCLWLNVCHYKSELKRHSMLWKHSDSPLNKIMLRVYCDIYS